MATTVAVAVSVGGGSGRGNGSKRAVRWAVENLMPQADRLVLVHVMPTITHIPSPTGDKVPIQDIEAHVAARYIKDVRERAQQLFLQYKTLNKLGRLEFDTSLLENDNIASALIGYVNQHGIKSLVMGSASTNRFWRKVKDRVPRIVLKNARSTSDVYVVYRRKLKKRMSCSLTLNDILTHKHQPSLASYNKVRVELLSDHQTPLKNSISTTDHHLSSEVSPWSELSPIDCSSDECDDDSIQKDDFQVPFSKDLTCIVSTPSIENDSTYTPTSDENLSVPEGEDEGEGEGEGKFKSKAQTPYDQLVLSSEAEQLRLELDTTMALYSFACDNLVQAQNEVQILSKECVQAAKKIDVATECEKTMWRIAKQENIKHLEAIKEVQEATDLLAEESNQRQIAELIAEAESNERQQIVEALICNEKRTRKYTIDEIRSATDCFSESMVIGEGGYGKVYKGVLDHTQVAIKVLQSDASDKKEEFLREVEILSQLHHPNIVLLLGVCPEMGCLVYEYMENGSLEDHIFRHGGREPLPWFARFRIAFEVACGLAFLHRNKPTPIVHRDLKPGNILLGRHCVSKIGDVGLAALIQEAVPDSVTMFGTSLLAGSLFYMDPEYQRTGTIRPKSDLYSFGIIILQLLTGRHPNGLLLDMENAIGNKCLERYLDDSITDWPLNETEELVKLALECCKLRCRDRPDLEKQVLPVLKKLVDLADVGMKDRKHNTFAPSYYFCPILHEIMEDPYIAADGFTYERKAIQAWLENNDISPVTKKQLDHFNLTPSMTLLTAIKEWKSDHPHEAI